MDGLSEEQQLRAHALAAAAQVVSENLPKFISTSHMSDTRTHSSMAVLGLAKDFEKYLRTGATR